MASELPVVYILVEDESYIKFSYESSTFDLSFREMDFLETTYLYPHNSYKFTTGVKTFTDSVDFLMVPRSSSGRLEKGRAAISPDGLHNPVFLDDDRIGVLSVEASSSIKLANTIGVIDRDYKGEWIAWVQADCPHWDSVPLRGGSFYLQAVPLVPCRFKVVTQIEDVPEPLRTSSRGEGGFGSSGA